MIRNRLIPEIKRCFSDAVVLGDAESNLIARIPGIQDEVGDVTIYDDGDEATVAIDRITHGHFGPDWDEELPADDAITESVIDFLNALFSDRVLLYINSKGGGAGWMRLDLIDHSVELKKGNRYFLWSRPYET